MPSTVIRSVDAVDARYRLQPGEGTDAIHDTEMYAHAAARIDAGSTRRPASRSRWVAATS